VGCHCQEPCGSDSDRAHRDRRRQEGAHSQQGTHSLSSVTAQWDCGLRPPGFTITTRAISLLGL
jgi:hypothetical protein